MPKRKRSNGFAKAAKRFKSKKTARAAFKRKLRRGYAPLAIRRPPFFRSLAPRVRTTHVNKLSVQATVPFPGFKGSSIRIIPNRLRDPHAAQQTNPFPENFITMASLYERYRVNGVKVYLSWAGLTNNENAKFYSCVYTTTAIDGTTDPYDTSAIGGHGERDSFLQQVGIRKKMIASSGTTGDRKDNVHKVGYFSLAGIEEMRRGDMVDSEYSGGVTVAGASTGDPIKQPSIWISTVSPRFLGFPVADLYDCNITLVFDVEWYDRRESLEADQGEVDP